MNQLAQLASRAGRRFIVASTMMKFIDDGDNDPRDRLELMLKLSSELLPGTEVFRLYDCILSTCADPQRAYHHLSVVAALADPLPISQISKLLGPGLGRDVEAALVQLRSVMDIPTDGSLPVNIFHSSVRDYVSDPSNCSLRQVQHNASPHSVLACSSLRLMMQDNLDRTALLDALSELNIHSQAMRPEDPQNLKRSLSFIIQQLEPLQILTCLLWLRGARSSDIHSWLETLDGHAWLQIEGGATWLQTPDGEDWLQTRAGQAWLKTHGAKDWLQTEAGEAWLQTWGGETWLHAENGRGWLEISGCKVLVQGQSKPELLETQRGQEWLETWNGRHWLETLNGRGWLENTSGQDVAGDRERAKMAGGRERKRLVADLKRGRLARDQGRAKLAPD
ncbi:hypothetical protein BDR05DRAFT_187390 [Suillus weaverae]|nr:hypothetical protein BDR05DRAFT_187390 [Suillus weaverae]